MMMILVHILAEYTHVSLVWQPVVHQSNAISLSAFSFDSSPRDIFLPLKEDITQNTSHISIKGQERNM
jgi:hypothetical protein